MLSQVGTLIESQTALGICLTQNCPLPHSHTLKKSGVKERENLCPQALQNFSHQPLPPSTTTSSTPSLRPSSSLRFSPSSSHSLNPKRATVFCLHPPLQQTSHCPSDVCTGAKRKKGARRWLHGTPIHKVSTLSTNSL